MSSTSEPNEHSPLNRLQSLVIRYLQDGCSTEHFVEAFETIFVRELQHDAVEPLRLATLQALFERVSWYSPFPEERAQIPNYISEDEVRAAARAAAFRLGILSP